MVTKSEEENIMEQAIGSKIADYLIKPVNPSQILLTLKEEHPQKGDRHRGDADGYQQDYQQISMQISDSRSFADWAEVYKRLVRWELELSSTESNMTDMLKMQKEEANIGFAKYIQQNYLDWVAPQQPARTDRFQLRGRKEEKPGVSRPTMSPDLFKQFVFPSIDRGEKVFLIVIDNFRFDQWRVLSSEVADLFDIDEQVYLSILPTATQYARNAIFSGLMPQQIAEMFPELWVDEDEEEGKNLNEKPLIQTQIDRYRRHDKFSYHKINDSADSDKYLSQFNNLYQNDFNVLVINFIDILSHARTEMKMIRELANNESAYRSITRFLVPPLGTDRPPAPALAERLQGHHHHRPWQHPHHEAREDRRRPQHQHQPALQVGQEPELPRQGPLRHQESTPRLSSPPPTSARPMCLPRATPSLPTPTITTTTCLIIRTHSSMAASRWRR